MIDKIGVWFAIVGGGLAVLGGLGALLRSAWRLVSMLRRFLDDWFGHNDQPSMPSRVAATESAVEEIKHELLPNSGRSLRDVADRIEQAVTPPTNPPQT